MRGGVCGMAAPGDPKMAAKLAWEDAIVSHHNNGVLGEIFNAVMVSLAFVEKDVKKVCRMAIDLMPDDSEYRTVVEYAWKKCEEYGNWRDAWLDCDEKYKHYSWIHAYPNAAAEVVAPVSYTHLIAARSLSPTARIRRPSTVLFSSTQVRATATNDR